MNELREVIRVRLHHLLQELLVGRIWTHTLKKDVEEAVLEQVRASYTILIPNEAELQALPLPAPTKTTKKKSKR